MAVMNETIHSPRHVVKAHTTAVNAFVSMNAGALGCVNAAGVRFYQPPARKVNTRPRFQLPDRPPLPAVAVIYAHAGMDAGVVEAAAAGGARGIVLAGAGNGNASAAVLDALAAAARRGLLVVRAARMPEGCVNRNVEVDDDRLGFVAALDLPPSKARILAQLLIASGISKPGRAQAAFEPYNA